MLQVSNANILLSGGPDSADALAVADRQDLARCANSFDYGQRHQSELCAAKPSVRLAALVLACSPMVGCLLLPVDRETPDWEIQPSVDWYAAEPLRPPVAPESDEVVAWPIGIRTVDNGGYVDIAFFGNDADQAATRWSRHLMGMDFERLFLIERQDGNRRTPNFAPRPLQFHHVGVASILMVSGQFEEPIPSPTPDPSCFILGVPLYSAAGWPAGKYQVQFAEPEFKGVRGSGQFYDVRDKPERSSDLPMADGRYLVRISEAADFQFADHRVIRFWRRPRELETRPVAPVGETSAPN